MIVSSIRKAYSVEIIDRRLRDCEAGAVDALELIGLHDELARVERKWLEKAAALKDGRKSVRPLANADQMNRRFERLARLVEVALRRTTMAAGEREWLERIAGETRGRKPLGDGA